MRILVLCKKGNVRSVALAYVLKKDRGLKNVVTSGVDILLPDTWQVLGEWADKIYIVGEKALVGYVPIQFQPKVKHFDIGRDRWNNPMDTNLQELLRQMLYRQGL